MDNQRRGKPDTPACTIYHNCKEYSYKQLIISPPPKKFSAPPCMLTGPSQSHIYQAPRSISPNLTKVPKSASYRPLPQFIQDIADVFFQRLPDGLYDMDTV